MARLPTPGGDDGTWGTVLNDYLSQVHAADGTLKSATVSTSNINAINAPTAGYNLVYGATGFQWIAPSAHSHAAGDITSGTVGTARLGSGTASATTYLRGDSSWQVLDKAAVGLANVDNTADLNKPVSTATQTALDGKADVGHTHASTDTVSPFLLMGA